MDLQGEIERSLNQCPQILEWAMIDLERIEPNQKLRQWVDRGIPESLDFMKNNLEDRIFPKKWFGGGGTVCIFLWRLEKPLQKYQEPQPKVAAYAQQEDYHHLIKSFLYEMWGRIESMIPLDGDKCKMLPFVDSAPVSEQYLAAKAGLGWIGKNSLLINRKWGSHFVLGGFMTNAPLKEILKQSSNHCGSCRLCVESCPTAAILEDCTLDAQRCISNLTIETKGILPEDLVDNFEFWIMGCDICQQVCPWNQKSVEPEAAKTSEEQFEKWISLCSYGGGFKSFAKGTPLLRAGRKKILRNLEIAVRQTQNPDLIKSLELALEKEKLA